MFCLFFFPFRSIVVPFFREKTFTIISICCSFSPCSPFFYVPTCLQRKTGGTPPVATAALQQQWGQQKLEQEQQRDTESVQKTTTEDSFGLPASHARHRHGTRFTDCPSDVRSVLLHPRHQWFDKNVLSDIATSVACVKFPPRSVSHSAFQPACRVFLRLLRALHQTNLSHDGLDRHDEADSFSES